MRTNYFCARYLQALALFMMAFLLLLFATGCTVVSPDAGQEAVLVKKPLFFGHGGVDPKPVSTGLTLAAFTTQDIYVNMQPIQFTVHFDDLMSSDGVPLDFDAVIRLKIIDSVRLIKEFGPQWYENNVLAEMRNRVRQAVRKHGMNETAISTIAIEAIDTEVSQQMEVYIKKANLPVRLVDITVGKANPPDSIKHQRIETATQEQRQMTEQQRKLAEDQRKMAEESRAAADNAYREKMQLSPSQFLQLENIKMLKEAAAKNATFIVGSDVSKVYDVNR
jgi:regulator of protease activity HflC (stomatin/prohibitin superfamily)